MPVTYFPIATTTLSGADVSSYTFTNIPSTYTDLVLVSSTLGETNISFIELIQFNSDTGNNYSNTFMGGYVTGGGSNRNSNVPYIFIGHLSGWFTTDVPMTAIAHIQNYSNTTTHKTVISRGGSPATNSSPMVGLWRNTSAINSIKISLQSGTALKSGSTFTLYGIKAA
jgi:hypothetical protein